jgi:hypothetical protein
MQVLRHPNEVLAFVERHSDPCITALIQQRMQELVDEDTTMEELVVLVILESGDGIEHLKTQMDMSVMTTSGYPLWEVIEEHPTCYELVFVLSTTGYGALVFAPKARAAQDILSLCQEHACRSSPCPPPDAIDATVAKDTAHRGGFLLPETTKEKHETDR